MGYSRRMEPKVQVSEIEERLRAASDAIQIAVVELHALEAQKRSVVPADDDRFVELATRVRDSAERILELARAEETFAGELAASAETITPIADVEPAPDLKQILDEWREVERDLNAAHPGSPEAHRLLARFEELRAEYMRASEQKRG